MEDAQTAQAVDEASFRWTSFSRKSYRAGLLLVALAAASTLLTGLVHEPSDLRAQIAKTPWQTATDALYLLTIALVGITAVAHAASTTRTNQAGPAGLQALGSVVSGCLAGFLAFASIWAGGPREVAAVMVAIFGAAMALSAALFAGAILRLLVTGVMIVTGAKTRGRRPAIGSNSVTAQEETPIFTCYGERSAIVATADEPIIRRPGRLRGILRLTYWGSWVVVVGLIALLVHSPGLLHGPYPKLPEEAIFRFAMGVFSLTNVLAFAGSTTRRSLAWLPYYLIAGSIFVSLFTVVAASMGPELTSRRLVTSESEGYVLWVALPGAALYTCAILFVSGVGRLLVMAHIRARYRNRAISS